MKIILLFLLSINLFAETNSTGDALLLGLTDNQWDIQLATIANLVGFTILFIISFLSLLISRK